MGGSQLSQGEIMELTGISRTTLFRLVQEGMPYSETPSGKKYFDEDVVRTFLKERKSKISQELVVGNNYSNEEIVRIFKVSNLGAMRRSHSRNALVLFIYDCGLKRRYNDYWKDDILYFSGHDSAVGKRFRGNDKTLAESDSNGITVYLFEKVQRVGFQYRGIVKLAKEPVLRMERDQDGRMYDVWKFPLKLINEKDYLDIAQIEEQESVLEHEMETLSENKMLVEEAENIELHGSERTVKTKVVQINTVIAEYVRMRANGNCELCKQKAPFEYNGRPYLVLTHIVPIMLGGKDSIKNVAAVCPNCNAKLDKLGNTDDMKQLKDNISWNEYRLQKKLKGE